MALGELTKQLAEQAIRNVAPSSPAPQTSDHPGAMVLRELQAMQKALKDDEELLVLYHAGAEAIRILEVVLPSWQLTVLRGVDPHKATTRIICPLASLQLVCKVLKVPPGARATRVNLIAPKS